MAQFTLQQALALALQHYQAGRLRDAEEVYRQIIAQHPEVPEAQGNLGNLLIARGEVDGAISAYRRAIASRPGFAEVHSNLGHALVEKGMLAEAVAVCREAIALNPNIPEAYLNLGNALKDMGKPEEAIAAYGRAIELRPEYAEGYGNLGNALKDAGELDAAVAAYLRAIAIRPGYAEAYNNLGNALKDMGRLEEAIAAYRKAIAVRPGYVEADSNLVYAMEFHPGYDAKGIANEQRRWSRQHAEGLQRAARYGNDRSAGRRIRVGYVSPDFRDHVVGRNLLPLFRGHDRGKFEITGYTQVACPDGITAEFEQCADRWRSISGLSDEQVAEQIRSDGIDILVDLTLHMGKNRLLVFARKAAPVQVTFAGYPGCTGLSAIDYRLSDGDLDPVGMDESVYSERTIRLPCSFWCYDPLDCGDVAVNRLPAREKGIVTFGCLNNFCKVNDGVLAVWARVMREAQDTRLVMLAPMGSHRERTAERLGAAGIDARRVEFVGVQSRREYLQVYHRIDLGLDTFPYNGHTTSLESFWMGVPVVTLVGDWAVGRAGWCQVSNLGLGELAGKTEGEFVQIAVRLAGDLARLEELRGTLRGRMERSALMDAGGFAAGIEAAYRGMWGRWCEAVTPGG